MDIDIVKEKIFEQINSIEHKILNNEATIQIIELDSKIFEIEKNSIGTIYNEFDQYNGYKLDLASRTQSSNLMEADKDDLETSENDSDNETYDKD